MGKPPFNCSKIFGSYRLAGAIRCSHQEEALSYVITEPCMGVKDASCLDVCPVDCISTTDEAEMYFIDPKTCIDCSYCESVCPVNAIFDEFTVPANQREFIHKNRDFFKNNR